MAGIKNRVFENSKSSEVINIDDISNEEILPGYTDIGEYSQELLKNVLGAVKASNDLPTFGDDYDFYSSFQGFRHLMQMEGKLILQVMSSVLRKFGRKGKFEGLELDDKVDLLIDANDAVLESVGNDLDEAAGLRKKEDLIVTTLHADRRSTASWNRKKLNVCDEKKQVYRLLAAKNVQRPQMKFKEKIDNSRKTIFVPIIKEKPNSIKPLAIIYEKTGDGSEECSHPYEVEIEKFQPNQEEFETCEPQVPLSIEKTPFVYIDKPTQLPELCQELKQQREIAVDLEHHSYRTFQGITCLMQISTREKDYIIDTLELRSDLYVLNEVFTDPKIIKILHGADMDILWLQRDLSLYIVNLFDTGQASRVLNFAHFSLFHLMKHYCKFEPDKQFQLADWRMRPLPQEMLRYAREDTHYLLYIYDRLKNDLLNLGNTQKNLLKSVYQRGQHVCLKRYKKPVFYEDGYMELYKKSKKVFNSRQLQALKELYSWRDHMAREEDESLGYVLPNHMLLQISEILPRDQQGILACCNPIPPLVRQQLNELHEIILKAKDTSLVRHKAHELHIQVSDAQSHIDLDSILHCPHDFPLQTEIETNLPTLLDNASLEFVTPETSLISEVPKQKKCILPLKSIKERKKKFLKKNSTQIAEVSSVFQTFISPYERYKLVKPSDATETIKETEDGKESEISNKRNEPSESNNDRVEELIEFCKQITTENTLPEDNSQGDESTNISQTNNKRKRIDTPLRQQKKSRKKTKVVSDVPLSSVADTPPQPIHKRFEISYPEDEPFTPFDYSNASVNSEHDQITTKEFNPDKVLSKVKGKKAAGKNRKRFAKSMSYNNATDESTRGKKRSRKSF